MKVKAGDKLHQYRLIVLGIEKKDFRELQKGGIVDIKPEIVSKFPEAFTEVKEKKDAK